MSQFYVTDPSDPEAPRVLLEYTGHHGTIRPGDRVVRQVIKSYRDARAAERQPS